jgi:hypothetical protein
MSRCFSLRLRSDTVLHAATPDAFPASFKPHRRPGMQGTYQPSSTTNHWAGRRGRARRQPNKGRLFHWRWRRRGQRAANRRPHNGCVFSARANPHTICESTLHRLICISANIARGRRRHVWVSTSSDLRLDAERDLRDLDKRTAVGYVGSLFRRTNKYETYAREEWARLQRNVAGLG